MSPAPQSLVERLVAGSRFVLAAAAFAAIYLDPLEPSHHPAITYSLLAGYAIYAAVLLSVSLLASRFSITGQIVSHTVDLTVFGVVNYLTAGPANPFFAFFVFVMIWGMLRFGPTGTVLTAASALAVFLLPELQRIDGQDFELTRLLIRVTYLVVMAALLVRFARYQRRTQRNLERIVRWPRESGAEHHSRINQLLSETISTLSGFSSLMVRPLMLLAYEHHSRRYAFLSDGAPGENRGLSLPSDVADIILSMKPGAEDELKAALSTIGPIPLGTDPTELRLAVAVAFEGNSVQGRLVLLAERPLLLEDCILAQLTANVIADRLDHFHATEQLQRGAVAEDRIRLARDLHDSTLQALTGIALQLRTLPTLMQQDPARAAERVAETEQVILASQKELRKFIDQLRSESEVDEVGTEGLVDRVSALAKRFSEQWELDVSSDIHPTVDLLPKAVRHEVFSIVGEAVANAARHAEAKHVSVGIRVEGSKVRITIADDGIGFPFHGTFDLSELTRLKRGPITLKERVASLRGELTINSSSAGAQVDILIGAKGA
jgi:signal transduction histidine kinase